MKKFGFTLAEVLIALAIVGIVASITLPTVTSSTRKESNLAKAKVSVSDIENAFSMMITSEGVQDLEEVKIWASSGDLFDELSKYIKVSETESSFTKTENDATVPDGTGVVMKNGAIVSFKTQTPAADSDYNDSVIVAEIKIDVNGSTKPNVLGVDQFEYVMDSYGMLTEK